MDYLFEVPTIFYLMVLVTNLLIAMFFRISPIRTITKHTQSIVYFYFLFLSLGLGFAAMFNGINALSVVFTNTAFVLSGYLLKYGLLWRKPDFTTHIFKDKLVLFNLLAICSISLITHWYFTDLRFLRVFIVNINVSLIVLSCIPHLALDKNKLSKGESVMKKALLASAIVIFITWFILYFTKNMMVYSAVIFVMLSLFALLLFGAIITLFLSDIINYHYTNSMTDPMTGLFNRRYFFRKAKNMLQQSKEKDLAVSLIICDIDNFKKVNDAEGHQAGDHVIKKFSNVLASNTSDLDVLTRFGGEEFIILLPETPVESAVKLAERIRAATEVAEVTSTDYQISFTASFGVSSFVSYNCIEDVLKAADNALYLAKANGKNCVYQA